MFNHSGGKAAHNHRTQQNKGEYKIIHLVFSLKWSCQCWGMEEGVLISSEASQTKKHYQLPPKADRQIRGGMGNTKELAKNCPKTYYMERSLISHFGSQTCTIQ